MLTNLKKLREDASVSQKALADAIGVSQQSVNKYENHNIEPDIDTLIRIADFFETSVDYLIGHTSVRRKIEEVHMFIQREREDKAKGGVVVTNGLCRQRLSLLCSVFGVKINQILINIRCRDAL